MVTINSPISVIDRKNRITAGRYTRAVFEASICNFVINEKGIQECLGDTWSVSDNEAFPSNHADYEYFTEFRKKPGEVGPRIGFEILNGPDFVDSRGEAEPSVFSRVCR
jgi:hypothetical protein